MSKTHGVEVTESQGGRENRNSWGWSFSENKTKQAGWTSSGRGWCRHQEASVAIPRQSQHQRGGGQAHMLGPGGWGGWWRQALWQGQEHHPHSSTWSLSHTVQYKGCETGSTGKSKAFIPFGLPSVRLSTCRLLCETQVYHKDVLHGLILQYVFLNKKKALNTLKNLSKKHM